MTDRQKDRIEQLTERVNLTDEWLIYIRFALMRGCTVQKASKIIGRLKEMEEEQSPDPRIQNMARWKSQQLLKITS